MTAQLRIAMSVALAVVLVGATLWSQSAHAADADLSEESDIALLEEGLTGEEHGEEEHPDYNRPPLELELPLFIWTLVTFLAFLFIARQFAWQPLIAGLDGRERRIVQALDDAERARIEAESLLAEHERRLATTQEDVRSIVAQARKEAEQVKAKIVADAEAEAARIREQALAEIDQAQRDAMNQLSSQIDAYADSASGHLLETRS